MSIADISRHFARLDLAALRQAALANAAETIAADLRATGEFPASIGVTADADQALIGSTSKRALVQERGTAKVPPRPFFSAVAADHAEAAATAIGAAVADAIRGA